jgi:hypothetical protein
MFSETKTWINKEFDQLQVFDPEAIDLEFKKHDPKIKDVSKESDCKYRKSLVFKSEVKMFFFFSL